MIRLLCHYVTRRYRQPSHAFDSGGTRTRDEGLAITNQSLKHYRARTLCVARQKLEAINSICVDVGAEPDGVSKIPVTSHELI